MRSTSIKSAKLAARKVSVSSRKNAGKRSTSATLNRSTSREIAKIASIRSFHKSLKVLSDLYS